MALPQSTNLSVQDEHPVLVAIPMAVGLALEVMNAIRSE
jgi:hypothetical protein